MDNIITVNIGGNFKTVRTRSLYQYDYGQILKLEGIELPYSYEVHFSNSQNGVSKTQIGNENGVEIPDEYLKTGDPIYVWLFLHTGTDDGETRINILIPVISRAEISDEEPILEEQSTITQTIAALNHGVELVEQALDNVHNVVNTTLQEAKDSGEFDGFSPTVTIEDTQEGATITVIDVNGTVETNLVEKDPTIPSWAKQPTKPSYTPEEIGALPINTFIPSKTSDLQNDSGYLTVETDPTVPLWAKAQNKPSYTAQEVGALPNNTFIPEKVSDLIDDSGHYTKPTNGIPASDLANGIIPDITVKADKVTNATNGNFASLNSNGNLVDSGHKHSDYLTEHQDISGKLDVSLKGTANGLAELDSEGKIPSSQLPSYVDDVLEYDSLLNFPATGETGKIYVAKDTNQTYRWGGSSYVVIGTSLALGETSSTAYRGDRGKIAYDHANAKGNAYESGLYKVTTNSEGHVTNASAIEKSDITSLGIPAQDTTYESKTATSGGNDVSLVTTGEKYNWNSKYDKPSNGIPASDLANGVVPDVTGKADKVSNATNGNFASLDTNGNLVDSGHKHSDYLTAHQTIPVTDVQVNGSSVLNTQGVANIPLASPSAPGVVVSGSVAVSGSTPTINGVDGVRYVCGEVATITINPPASGCIDVIFSCGSTASILTVPNTVKWPVWFDPTALDPNTTYEINILDGMYGAVGTWTV